MTPTFSRQDLRDRSRADAIARCQDSVRISGLSPIRSDLLCSIISQFGTLPSTQILTMRYRLKVRGIYARRVSAKVVEFSSVRNQTVYQLPRIAVSEDLGAPAPIAILVSPEPNPAWCWVAAVAHLVKFRRPKFGIGTSARMALAETLVFSFYPSIAPVVFLVDRRLQSAATLAKSWRYRIFGHAALLVRVVLGERGCRGSRSPYLTAVTI